MHESQGKYRIEVTVKSQKGKCWYGHEPGEKIVFNGVSVKGDLCYSAMNTLWPIIFAMHHGAVFPWGNPEDVIVEACPDGANPVEFEVRRIKDPMIGRWAPEYEGESKNHKSGSDEP